MIPPLVLLYNIRLERSFSIERFQLHDIKNQRISAQSHCVFHFLIGVCHVFDDFTETIEQVSLLWSLTKKAPGEKSGIFEVIPVYCVWS